MRRTAVLIVGAGPSGLMMAAQLTRFGIPYIILDKEKGPTTESRAIGIQARTLEIFKQMGIADDFVTDGYKAKGLNFVVKGKVVQHIPLYQLGKGLTEFPFLLIHEQQKTEQKLMRFLRNHQQEVEYSSEVLSFTQESDHVITTIKNAYGYKESITSEYIIGCDGAHSIVRHILGIQLEGKTYQQSLFVLDCKVDGPLPKDDLSVVVSDTSFSAFFPMTHNHWRVVGEIPKQFEKNETITFDQIKETLPKDIEMPVILSEPYWISRYRSHHRCVETFREGRAFLVGDAAHIHSPIGAQGMNTGFQDAYNLAWKLAFVIERKARECLLDSYNTERIAFARKLVETTDRVFNLFITPSKGVVFFREYIAPRIIKQVVTHKKTGQFAFRTVSQIGISYHHSPLSESGTYGTFAHGVPLPGDRLPYVLYKEDGKEKNIQNIITSAKLYLLLFTDNEEQTKEIIQYVASYKQIFQVLVFPFTNDTKSLYKQFGILYNGYYLIRPDMYIARRSQGIHCQELIDYLSRFFVSNGRVK